MAREARDIDAIFAEGTKIDRALEEAERRAILKHQRAGLPMPMWVDGKVKWVNPSPLLSKTSRKTRSAK